MDYREALALFLGALKDVQFEQRDGWVVAKGRFRVDITLWHGDRHLGESDVTRMVEALQHSMTFTLGTEITDDPERMRSLVCYTLSFETRAPEIIEAIQAQLSSGADRASVLDEERAELRRQRAHIEQVRIAERERQERYAEEAMF